MQLSCKVQCCLNGARSAPVSVTAVAALLLLLQVRVQLRLLLLPRVVALLALLCCAALPAAHFVRGFVLQ
jgi:hypothetical protein